MENSRKKELPFHVAIIPDGNRRWAKSKSLKSWEGHEEGAKRVEELSQKALDMGIKCVTFWGSSRDNLIKRPFREKMALLNIYERYFKRLIKNAKVYKNKVRINVIGRWREQFPSGLKKILESGIEKTKNHKNNFLNFLLAYDGSDDMIEAIKRIAEKAQEKISGEIEITEKLIAQSLLTRELPAVDLIIRTGTEDDPHNSAGFLMWQTRDSQYYFSGKMFPDFKPADFEKAIQNFQKRERRLGK